MKQKASAGCCFRVAAFFCWFLLCAPQGWAGTEKEATPVRFYFTQITDTHWGALDSLALTRKAVAVMNRLPVKLEFVVHTGDIFADTIRDEHVVQEGLEAMKAVHAPVYYVPGNHDILKDDSDDTAQLFKKYFGEVNGRVEVRGVVCLFVCTELLNGDRRSPGQAQREWLEENLHGTSGRPTLVFMHRPPVWDMLDQSKPGDWLGEEYHPGWAQLLKEAPQIKAMITGHLHRDELHWIGDVPVYVASSLARFWDRQPSFRLYEYRDQKLQYWTIYLSEHSDDRTGKSGGGRRAVQSEKR